MSTLPAVTMQDLELEHAELLPSRETLNCCTTTAAAASASPRCGGLNGNTDQAGLGNVSALNGNNVLVVL